MNKLTDDDIHSRMLRLRAKPQEPPGAAVVEFIERDGFLGELWLAVTRRNMTKAWTELTAEEQQERERIAHWVVARWDLYERRRLDDIARAARTARARGRTQQQAARYLRRVMQVPNYLRSRANAAFLRGYLFDGAELEAASQQKA